MKLNSRACNFASEEITLERELEVRDREDPMRDRGQTGCEAHKAVSRDHEKVWLVRVGAPVVNFLLCAAERFSFATENDCAEW